MIAVAFRSHGCFGGDLEHFNFSHFEVQRTRENRLPEHSAPVHVRRAKVSATEGICIAGIRNKKINKMQIRFSHGLDEKERARMRNSEATQIRSGDCILPELSG
jgi:hypothetical protein